MWCDVLSCDVMWSDVTSCDLMWIDAMWCNGMGYTGMGWEGCVLVIRCGCAMRLAVRSCYTMRSGCVMWSTTPYDCYCYCYCYFYCYCYSYDYYYYYFYFYFYFFFYFFLLLLLLHYFLLLLLLVLLLLLLRLLLLLPVVPHEAVAEVSRKETYRRDGLLESRMTKKKHWLTVHLSNWLTK